MPRFSPDAAYFLNEFDGLIVWPMTRGEGKFHEQGRNLKKQIAFDDVMEVAKILVDNGYTEYKQITICGVSHGGLVVASCINQAPWLFGCAIPEVGLMDIIRFPESAIGHAFTGELGNPANETELENILKYSPLHTVHNPTSSDNQYPATLIMAADNDDQVPPFHSLKYAAELQFTLKDNKFQKNPTLLRIYKGVGHGSGKTVMQQIEEATDKLTFMHQVINAEAESTSVSITASDHKKRCTVS